MKRVDYCKADFLFSLCKEKCVRRLIILKELLPILHFKTLNQPKIAHYYVSLKIDIGRGFLIYPARVHI